MTKLNLAQTTITYVSTLVLFLALDGVWLGFIANHFYRTQLGESLATTPVLPAAILFYLVYVAGLVIFAVEPNLRNDDFLAAAFTGALFGFFAYATYDLTNLATLRNWPVMVSVVDLAWGTFVSGVTSGLGVLATRALMGVLKI